MMSLALLNYFRTLDPDIPYNSGLIRPVRMELPRGSILNPDPGLACGVRAATFIRVMDCIMACLAQALPDATPAASSGAIAIVLLSALDHESGERRITVAQPLSGGSGARPRQDGIEGTSFTGGWLRNVPNEVLEGEMPILIEEYGYAIDSAAPGRTRGGSAIRFRFRNLGDATVMTARGLERFRFQPWGYRGGHAGSAAHVVLHAADGDRRDLGQLDLIELEAGASVEFLTPSGGGYGDPLARSPAAVLADVEAGFITLEAARRDYGVVIRNGEVEEAETDRERHAHSPTDTRGFTAGPARAAYEAQWPEQTQRAVIGLLMRLPASKRALLRRQLEICVAEETAHGRRPDAARLEELLGKIEHVRRE
jgi:N-methylhydantoinase B